MKNDHYTQEPVSLADKRAARAAGRRSPAEQQAYDQGARDERTRIGAILKSPEARGRFKLAKQIALTSDVTPAQAASVLASAPIEGETGQ